jgi:hypothetical protein
MKVLVSVNKPVEASDFCFVPDGEIVYELGLVCSNSSTCGCDRSLSGTDTLKATTTMEVREVDLSEGDLLRLAADVGERNGFGGRIVLVGLDSMREAAGKFPVDTLVRAKFDFDAEEFVYEACN